MAQVHVSRSLQFAGRLKILAANIPEATEVIKNGFYVDDLCDSCPTVESR